MRLPPVIIIGLSTVNHPAVGVPPALGNPYLCLMFAVAGIPNGRQTTNVTNEPLEKTMLRITNPTQPKPWYLVNPKIAGKWMFIPLKMVFS